jgi:type II secretory pathway pseudopilin PulG
MQQPTERSTCHFPSRPCWRSAVGFGLVFIMITVTVLLVGLTVALPSVLQQGQREREAEVIFRGTEYARAIALFHRRFNRYPASVQELLQTNMIRFLRQEYTDPMDPNGKWRFIHVNAVGVIIDSKTDLFGSNKPGNKSNQGTRKGQGRDTFSGSTSRGFGLSPVSTTDSSSNTSSPSSDLTDSPVQGGFIIGVAPTSHAKSIRVWNKQDEYDKWEFLGIDPSLFVLPAKGTGMPGASTPPPSPNQGGAPGAPPPTSPGNYSRFPSR